MKVDLFSFFCIGLLGTLLLYSYYYYGTTNKKNADKLSEVNQLDFDSASERVSNLSGVNLDEEAANLMKFQQSYMASSRIMSVAKETFDTLMRAV